MVAKRMWQPGYIRLRCGYKPLHEVHEMILHYRDQMKTCSTEGMAVLKWAIAHLERQIEVQTKQYG